MTSLLRGTTLITGAGSGIGQHAAYAFANHGIRNFALCDINPTSLKQTTSQLKAAHKDVSVLELNVDTSKEDSVHSAIDSTVKSFSRIDVAVNNAGVGGSGRHTHEMELTDWQRVMSINLNGVWLCQRAQIRQMLKQEPLIPPPRGNRGVIVNVASMLGLKGSSPEVPACEYTASKHGVVGLTRTDAAAYAKEGIRINAICPGYVATPLLKNSSSLAAMQAEIAKVPQQRLGDMEEIADSIVYMASPMASFMTGSAMTVDGGYTA
ncbi:Hypothetical predicted protein [Lecanosticta acicola]|uniref:Uncharacterized protein n=1 Tax=Lecanosticta acicola TaxID=111012 RepID=A0AAI9ED46_9PEZI|nr:Hypothetical predicted protein [Lecanosticta acicola]